MEPLVRRAAQQGRREGVQLIGFADDLALVAVARTSPELETVVNVALKTNEDWMEGHELQLASQETEAVMLTRKRAYTEPVFNIGGFQVAIKKSTKYLGVVLDSHRTFSRHLNAVSNKAVKTAFTIGRLMPNVGGPGQGKKALLILVVSSMLF